MSAKVMKRKVCLVGESGVGKTSLIRRFVEGLYDDAYIATLGAVVKKKTVHLPRPDGPVQVDLVVMDIMGSRTFMQLFREAYFAGAAGVLAVYDLTDRRTLRALPAWIGGVRQAVGDVPVVVIGNKADLEDRIAVSSSNVVDVLGPIALDTLQTSAKTGDNVEAAFLRLASMVEAEARRAPTGGVRS